MTLTQRQRAWTDASEQAAREGDDLSAGFFSLLALPNNRERTGHSCREHAIGFSREGRRGFKCGICGDVVKWVDPE